MIYNDTYIYIYITYKYIHINIYTVSISIFGLDGLTVRTPLASAMSWGIPGAAVPKGVCFMGYNGKTNSWCVNDVNY